MSRASAAPCHSRELAIMSVKTCCAFAQIRVHRIRQDRRRLSAAPAAPAAEPEARAAAPREQREDGGVRADPERERGDDDEVNTGGLAQRASVGEVLPERVDHWTLSCRDGALSRGGRHRLDAAPPRVAPRRHRGRAGARRRSASARGSPVLRRSRRRGGATGPEPRPSTTPGAATSISSPLRGTRTPARGSISSRGAPIIASMRDARRAGM